MATSASEWIWNRPSARWRSQLPLSQGFFPSKAKRVLRMGLLGNSACVVDPRSNVRSPVRQAHSFDRLRMTLSRVEWVRAQSLSRGRRLQLQTCMVSSRPNQHASCCWGYMSPAEPSAAPLQPNVGVRSCRALRRDAARLRPYDYSVGIAGENLLQKGGFWEIALRQSGFKLRRVLRRGER